jgi:hypothetical protein
MSFLRRVPLPRLLAFIGVLVIAGAGGAYAASAMPGPRPAPTSLAAAVHAALSASPVPGFSASITLTDDLVSGDLDQSSPLLTGGSGRLWVSADGEVRLELQSDSGDTEIYYRQGSLSYFDPTSNTLYRVAVPALVKGASLSRPGARAASEGIPSVAQIQQAIEGLMGHADVSEPTPGDVSGEPAYSVRISPSQGGGLLGGVALWWDAVHGVPLQIAVYAVDQTAPVLDLAVTSVSYGPVDGSVFDPPAAAKQVDAALPDSVLHAQGQSLGQPAATGAQAVRAALPFSLSAPPTLSGMALTGVRLVGATEDPAALLLYGHGLGALAVVERRASSQDGQGSLGAGAANRGDPSLPAIKVGGISATELVTALGTVVQFDRGGISYTVAGSVSSDVAASAARGL